MSGHKQSSRVQSADAAHEASVVDKLKHDLADKDARIAHLEETLNQMRNTLGWRLLDALRRVRERLLPPGTIRRKGYDLFIRALRFIQREGIIRFFKRVALGAPKPSVPVESADPYETWIFKNEPAAAALIVQRDLAGQFRNKPKISIITPVYNPDKKIFTEMIESVISQTYENWELCLADASLSDDLYKIASHYISRGESRIILKRLAQNKGIAGNSNEALALATGDFVALLDHDDTLAPFALFEVAQAVNNNPDVDFIYSDRDIISFEGKRIYPFFKPDWSPDYLLAQNYVCHLNVIRKRLMDQLGGFREGFDGSQDYDLVLRVTERSNKIIHIPKILYHWRMVVGSASVDETGKPYAYDAARRALQEAVSRRGWHGTVTEGFTKGLYRVRFQITGNPKVSIVIPTKDKVDVLKKCVDSILDRTTYANFEIVVVDNQSTEHSTAEYYRELSRDKRCRVLTFDRPFNFSEINNYAAAQVTAEYIIFLNNDTEIISADWIEVMLGFAQRDDVGAVTAKLIYPDDSIQCAGLLFDEEGNIWRSHYRYPRNSLGNGFGGRIQSVQNLSIVAAACMMLRKKVFDEVGGFDPRYVVAHGDIDLCLKIRQKNYLIVYEPHAEIYHHESLTRGYEDTPEKVERFLRETDLMLEQWGDVIAKGDPYYNPNLSPKDGQFDIRA